MHTYSLDTDIRRHVYIAIGIIALGIPAAFEKARTLFGLPVNIGFPVSSGALYSVMLLITDRWLWRWFARPMGLPDLNGKWIAAGKSSYENPETGRPHEFSMTVQIRQSFSKLEVFTQTESSTSRSTLAGICTEHAVPIFRYAFENAPKSVADAELQRHPGLIELRIESDNRMVGDYFSGKHRLRFGELQLAKEQE